MSLEDHFHDFADRARAAAERGDVIRLLTQFLAGVGHRDAETGRTDRRQVGEIVADVADLRRIEPQLAEDIPHRRQLVVDPLAEEFDPQFRHPRLHDLRTAVRYQSETVARLLPQPDAHSVADVEPFDLDPLIVQHDAAVGQYAVDVGKDQLYGSAALVEGHGRGEGLGVRGEGFGIRG